MATFKVTGQIRDTTTSGSRTTYGKSNVSVTGAGGHEDRRVVTVGTSEESFTISTDIGNAGLIYMENLDSTNFVQFGYVTTEYWERLSPGVPHVLELEPTVATLFMKADTAACQVVFHIFEA